MNPELYLKQHHVMAYVEDAVAFLLERKDEDSKVKPYEVLADYFKSVRDGSHVLFRDYGFVSSTPHNRASFIKAFYENYSRIAGQGRLMHMAEYLSLLRLLCHDFPSEFLLRVAKIIFSSNALDSLASFQDFLHVFQVAFYYEGFLARCEEEVWVRRSAGLDHPRQRHALRGATVVIPGVPAAAGDVDAASSRPASSVAPPPTEAPDRAVDVESASKALSGLIQQLREGEPWESCPSFEAVGDALASGGRRGGAQLTFHDFVLALARSDRVSDEIGVLSPCHHFPSASSS